MARKAKEIRREEIAAAALDVVAAHGISGMTVERVARLVGVVPSALYRHFGSKAEILDAVLDMLAGRMADNVRRAREGAPDNALEALRLLLLRQVGMILHLQALPRILFSDQIFAGDPGRRDRLHAVLSGFIVEVEGLVRQGQEQGLVRAELSPSDAGVMFIGLYAPLAILYHASQGARDITAQAERNWRIFERALRVRGGE